jgi:small-conductance mechanosensitive channel
MAMNIDLSPVERLVESIAGKASPTEWLLQLGVAAAGFGLAWLVARSARRRVRVNARWTFGKGGFERVAFPFLALAFVWAGKRALASFQGVAFLDVAVTLLVAFAVIRLSVYVLGHVIPEGGLQRIVLRIVYWAAWIVAVLYVTGLLPEVTLALESHGFTLGRNKITLLDILKGVVALFIALVFALWVSRVTESRMLVAESMEMTTRVVIAKVVRVTTVFVAIFIALGLAGIDVTTLSIFGGALGVGLGFGLQKVAANYVCGFIVLLDRSLRIGDLVTVDNRRGEVRAIKSRYTVIKGTDGVESIIPNEKMITEIVSHQSYSDPKVSMVIGVTVSYESDVDRACAILAEVAERQPRVIGDPPAAGRVKQLTERGIELELTLWIADPLVGDGDLKSDILKDVLKAYRAEGIEIPYPRHDIRMIATPETQNKAIPSRT